MSRRGDGQSAFTAGAVGRADAAPRLLKRYRIPHNLPEPVRNLMLYYVNTYRTTLDEVLRGGRATAWARPARRKIIGRLRAQGYSLPQIGRWLRLHHTSVLYQLRRPPNESE